MGHPPDFRAAPADFFVVGASHKSSSATLRDRMFIEPGEEAALLGDLRVRGIAEAVILSTCDRVEVHGVASDRPAAIRAARNMLEARLGVSDSADDAIRTHEGDDAVRYLFAIAASLESVVIGEPDVLGQVKEAHARARAAGAAGPILDAIFERGYSVAKDVRTNTAVAEGPVSLANATLRVVRNLFGELSGVRALLIGPGEMGLLMLDHLRANGLDTLTVAGPTPERAASAAHAFAAHAITYNELAEKLPGVDLVICAAGTGRILIDAAGMRAVIRARRRKPVFILDVAVPGDADRDVAELDDVFLYDLDDLETVARENRAAREAAAREAWAIVDRHVSEFTGAMQEREAASAVSDLRGHFERIRAETIAQSNGLDADEITRRLINRLLHEPSAVLRAAAREGGAEKDIEGAVRRLFDMDDNRVSPDGDPTSRSDDT